VPRVTDATTPRPRRRGLRRLLVAFAVLAVLLVAVLGGAGWYYAGEISSGALEVDPSPRTLQPDVVVESVDGDAVVLRRTDPVDGDDPLRGSGTEGLLWDGGSGVVSGPAEVRDDGSVQRRLEVVDGTAPEAGTAGDLRGDVWTDPRAAYGVDYEEVDVPCDGGSCPAWFVPGESSTWMVFVHGKGGSRTESLRALGPAVDTGLPSLIVTYRNDPEAPADPSGRYGYGATEWRDLEAAVRHAVDSGAERVVLFGASMGGAIVAGFLERSAEAGVVSGIVLDAPMLDLEATVEHGAAQRDLPVVGGVPDVLTGTAEWIAGWRYDLDWDATDYLPADWLEVPALVFHGTADDLVPITTTDAFAAERPDLVTAVRVDGAGHVRAWNADPAAYDRRVGAFLDCLASGGSCAGR
jgi:pimeloyl-ACP methyl ester carboxylesterase